MIGWQFTAWSQIIVKPVAPQFQSKSIQRGARTKALQVDTTALPFWDDFSTSTISPSIEKWNIADGVYVNGNWAENPPSLNVVSFDGLDANGTPYQSESTSRLLDVLESQAINLSQTPAGEEIIFSFYYQRTGYGEKPEAKDSLRVLMKNIDGEWVRDDDLVLTGISSREIEPFQKVSFTIDNPALLHEGFQFKFENYGNPTGAFDVWHVDYIRVDSYDLNNPDWESINDHAISRKPLSLFKRYTNIPFDQFFSYPDSIFTDPSFSLYSLFSGQQNPDFILTLTDTISKNILFNEPQSSNQLILFGIDDVNNYSVTGLNMGYLSGLEDLDSLLIKAELAFDSENDQEYRINDTSIFLVEIHETLSYDDGTVESAGGLNQSGGEIAIQYTIPTEDTLTHVDIYFPQFLPEPTTKTLDLIIYSDLSGEQGSVLRRNEIFMSSGDAINRFTRYELSRPVVLPQGDFFISLRQRTNDYIPYGLDKNTNNWDRIFFKPDETWIQNTPEQVSGSFMIRAIFADNEYEVLDADITTSSIKLYPNPANQYLTIDGRVDSYEIIDLSGQSLSRGSENQIHTGDLKSGIYLIKILAGEQVLTQRIVIRH